MFFFKRKSSDSEDDIDITKAIDKTESEITAALAATKISCSEDDKNSAMFFYKRIAKHYLADDARKNDNDAVLTATAYHKQLHILVTGKKVLFGSDLCKKFSFRFFSWGFFRSSVAGRVFDTFLECV